MKFHFSGTPQKRGFGCACVLCLPWPERFRQPEAWAPSPRVRRAFSLRGEWPRQPEACSPSPRVRRAFSLRGERLRQPEAWAHFPRMWCAFSLGGPMARCRSGLRKSLDRNRGLFAGWEGLASLGLSLPLSPPPCLLPPAGMGRLFSGVSQSLCFVNRRQCVRAG